MTMIRQHLAQLRASMAHTEGDCCNADCSQGRQCPRHPADERADAAADFLLYMLVALVAVACVSAVVFA